MKKLAFLLVFLFVYQTSLSYAGSGPCPRQVALITYSHSDPGFNAGFFFEHFGKLFQSPQVELGENKVRTDQEDGK